MDRHAFSIDLGGTTTNFSMFISDKMISAWTVKTPKRNVLDMIESEISNKMDEFELKNTDFKAIVIGVPGIVKDGIVQECINLNWSHIDVAQILESRIRIRTIVLNDVNLQAIGESKHYDNLFLVTIGTGIGAGLIINGRIVNGFNGAAGEIGHIYLDSETPEENASAGGLVRTVENYLVKHKEDSRLRNKDNLTAKDIFDAAWMGDEAALKIIHDVYFKFGKLLAIVSSAFDPEVIIISGGVSNAGDLLLNPIREGYREVAFRDCEIKLSDLRENSSIFGAMRLIKCFNSINDFD